MCLDCVTARILLLNNDMGSNDEDYNNDNNDDSGECDCTDGGEGRGQQRHPPPR